jgi:hypothetical protein
VFVFGNGRIRRVGHVAPGQLGVGHGDGGQQVVLLV